MILLTNEHSFVLKMEEIAPEFRFSGSFAPVLRGDICTCSQAGFLPVPEPHAGDRYLLPVDDGIAVPADDLSFSIDTPFCCREATMSMLMIERRGQYLLIALESGADAAYSVKPGEDGLLHLRLKADTECRVSYYLSETLGEACRMYRSLHHPDPIKTLSEKFDSVPEAKKLRGGAIFWVWNNDYEKVMYSDEDCRISPLAKEDILSAACELDRDGVRRAMFGIFFEPDGEVTKALSEEHGYLSVKYDNYNDVPPADLLDILPPERVRGCDYAARRVGDYPDGIQIKQDGKMLDAWALRGFDGKLHPQKTLCPVVAAERMLAEIPAAHRKYPAYTGYFVDVFGGSVSACYSEKHPLTRRDCVSLKKETFRKLSAKGYLIGTEDGFDDLCDGIVYAEGLHSPFPFRYDRLNCGRRKAQQLGKEAADFQRSRMLSPEYRVPLWELTYHDAVFAFPYWGDSTNCVADTMEEKTMFARLYATPPLFSFFAKDFPVLRDRIVKAYREIAEVTEKVGISPMTDFRYLTDDRLVQVTVFGEDGCVFANFSDHTYCTGDVTVPPHKTVFMKNIADPEGKVK